MKEPALNGEEAPAFCERLEYLKMESEHFYTSEFHSEQRASWLLTLAFGMQAVVLNGFVQMFDHKLNSRSEPALVICSICLFCTICFALWAIWPLQGSRASLSRPWRSGSAHSAPEGEGIIWWERHYEAHRLRAEIKVVRVVWTLLSLVAGVAAGIAATFMNWVVL